jgi:type II secretion system protein D
VVHFFEVNHRKASEIAPELSAIFAQGQVPNSSKRGRKPNLASATGLRFQGDDLRQRIMFMGPESHFDKIESLLEQLDQPGQAGVAKVYALQSADPLKVEEHLKGLFGMQRWSRNKAFQMIRDDNNRRLIIRASELTHQELSTIIADLDIKDDGDRNLKAYILEYTDASEVAKLISNIINHGQNQNRWAPKSTAGPLITVDRNANALMVLANAEGHLEVSGLIATVDKESREKKVTQYYVLKHANLEGVAKNLRELYPRPRGWRGAEDEMSITMDLPTRTLIIKAEISRQMRIAETISKLDIDGADSRTMKSYPVMYVDVHEASRLLTEIIGTPQRSRWDKSPNTSDIIRTDRLSSAIIVFGSQETHNQVLEAMNSIDVPNAERYQTVFYKIENADPLLLHSNLREFFGSGRSRNRGQQDLFISLNPLSRTLMVKATPEKQREVADAVKKLDIAGADPRQLVVYTLQYAGPHEASKVLSNLLNLKARSSQGHRGHNPYPDLITVDEANSSIVLFAMPETHDKAKTTLETLDVESSAEEQIVYYRTQHLPLLEAVNLLKDMFNLQTGSSNSRRGGITERLTLDENSNTIIITAAPRTHAKVRDVLKQVDVIGLGSNELHYYPVENTTASDAAKMVEQLFGLPTRSPKGNSIGARSLPLQRNPMVIANDESNTLIVNAPRSTHKDIEEMLNSLRDIGQVDKMTVRFYPLENTDAKEIAAQISELFSLKLGDTEKEKNLKGKNMIANKRSSGGSLLRPLRPEEQELSTDMIAELTAAPSKSDRNAFFFDGQPTVIPEVNLNSIILVAPGYLHEEVERTVNTMDKRRPQVMVEVAIVEVKGEDGLDLGVEWSYLDKNIGVATPFGLREDRPSGEGLGNLPLQGAAVPMQGLVIGALNNGKMPMVLKAMQNQRNLSIRSTPVLLVNDNEEAVFSSLTEEPTISTTQSNSSTAISFNGFVDAGTSLTITPHISQGHYIRLEVNLKVETFTGEPISAGVPPAKSSNGLVTSVTVPDRQMVIIGGMVSEYLSDTEKKVPLLGDLPLLGSLFKTKSKGKTMSKLYLFMAPKILRDEGFEDLREITKQKSIQLQSIAPDTKESRLGLSSTTVPSMVALEKNSPLNETEQAIIKTKSSGEIELKGSVIGIYSEAR